MDKPETQATDSDSTSGNSSDPANSKKKSSSAWRLAKKLFVLTRLQKIYETAKTMFVAARYSYAFCMRNCKALTIFRLIVAVAMTLIGYFIIQAMGWVVNSVQASMGTLSVSLHSWSDFVKSPIFVPALTLCLTILLASFMGKMDWFVKTSWAFKLRYANRHEIDDHRATLDVARVKSKEFDDLSKRITELPTGWQTRAYFSDASTKLFTTIVSFVLFGASLLWFHSGYALILFLTAIPMAVIEFKSVTMFWDICEELVPTNKVRASLERAYGTGAAFLQALMFNQMPHLATELKGSTNYIIERYDKIRRTVIRNESLAQMIAILGLSFVICHIIWSMVVNGGNIGTLTVVMALARTFQSNLEAIVSQVADQWNSAKGVILIEEEFFRQKPMIKTVDPIVPAFSGIPHIRFENVGFAYPGSDTLAVKNVSFEIRPGQKIAIVGKSGNGKSTIQSLLMRHYDPGMGRITADGIDLRHIEPAEWNKYASSLTQEYAVIERRIGQEIASSRLGEEINPEELTSATLFANFDEVLDSDPQGLESQIGTAFGGREFSGGERQRLALARVKYRGTPIFVLDEPDAKLDPDSAEKVMDKIFALKGVTVIVITHHVSRAERCDHVIVMGKGEIAEQGSHDELMARNGTYTRMFKRDRERLGSG